MPLPNSRIIPPGWSAHHRGPLESAWTGTCRITRATGGGTTDDNGVWTPGGEVLLYDGPCRLVVSVGDEQAIHQGGERISFRDYMIQVRAETDVAVGDTVEITSAPNASAVGCMYRVETYGNGTETWSTDLIVTEFQGGD